MENDTCFTESLVRWKKFFFSSPSRSSFFTWNSFLGLKEVKTANLADIIVPISRDLIGSLGNRLRYINVDTGEGEVKFHIGETGTRGMASLGDYLYFIGATEIWRIKKDFSQESKQTVELPYRMFDIIAVEGKIFTSGEREGILGMTHLKS